MSIPLRMSWVFGICATSIVPNAPLGTCRKWSQTVGIYVGWVKKKSMAVRNTNVSIYEFQKIQLDSSK